MIVVNIKIDFRGLGEERNLSVIAIANIAGDSGVADYRFAISHQIDSVYGKRAAKETGVDEPTANQLLSGKFGKWVWKKGIVKNFERQKGVVKLIADCLHQAGL